MSTLYNYQITINNFYKDSKLSFKIINEDIINDLKEKANNINKFCEYKYPKTNKIEKYIKILELVQTSSGGFDKLLFKTNSNTEKYLLFMFCIDPNFEAFLVYSTYNNIKEIKYTMIETFGIYDPKLIQIEKHFIKYFLTKKEKKNLDDKIKKRVFN